MKAVDGDKTVWRPLAEIWEFEKRKLTQLPDRFFWWKSRRSTEPQFSEVPYIPALDELPNYDRLYEALMMLEKSAFNLAGIHKVKGLPEPLDPGMPAAEETGKPSSIWS